MYPLLKSFSVLFLLISFEVYSLEKDINKDCPFGYASHVVAPVPSNHSCSQAAKKHLNKDADYYCQKTGFNNSLFRIFACPSKKLRVESRAK